MADAARAVVPATKPAPSERLPAERIAAFVRDVVARSALYAWCFTANVSPDGTAPTFTRAGKILFQILQREEAGPLVDVRAVETELAAHPELLPDLAAVGTGEPEQSQASAAQVVGANASSAPADVATVPAAGETNMDAGKANVRGAKNNMGGGNMATAPAKMDMPESMSPTAFARWLGVDRRSIRRNIIEIPPGPVPTLPPGKIPARRIANSLRVLRRDLFGEPGAVPPQVIEVGGIHGHGKETPTNPAAGALHRSIADLRDRYAKRE